jgi:hypothetical protein
VGSEEARKSDAVSERRLTFAPVTALLAMSEFFTDPFLICLERTLFFGSCRAA